MNIMWVNIECFTGCKRIKQRRISFVPGYLRMILKIKKWCYTDLPHFSTRKYNLVSFFGWIVVFYIFFFSGENARFTEWGHCVGHQWSYSWIYEYYSGKHWMLYWMQENQTATYDIKLCDKVCLPQYNWNIVESGIKHH
jgi:hypothetical protein